MSLPLFVPPAWPLATVSYTTGSAGRVTLQRWVILAVIDLALLASVRGALRGVPGVASQLLLLLALLVISGASLSAAPQLLLYAVVHVVVVAVASAAALWGSTHPAARGASTWTPGLGLIVPAGLLVHSAALRLIYCNGGSLAWGDVGTSVLLGALGVAQSRWGSALHLCGGGSKGGSGAEEAAAAEASGGSDSRRVGGDAEGADVPLLEEVVGEEDTGDTDTRGDAAFSAPRSLHDVASRLSVAVFDWLNPLFALGLQRQLHMDDLEALPARDGTSAAAAALEAAVVAERAAAHTGSSPPRRPRLLRALLCVFGREWALIGLLQVGCVACALASPLVLQQLLNYFETPPPTGADGGGPVGGPGSPWRGLGWATLTVALQGAAALVTAQFSYRVTRLQLRVRGALLPAVQRRVLAAPLGARRRTSGGALTNYVSVDIDRVLNAVPSVHQFWTLPLQVLFVLLELHGAVSWAAGGGLSVLVVLVPLNIAVASRIGAATKVMMAARDERVRVTSELLGGIRAVKMGAWELPLLARVAAARAKEFAALARRKYLDAVCVWCWACTPLLMTLATFALLVALPAGAAAGAFSPARVWSTLAMLNMLIFPLNAFPWVLSGLLEARVSLRRLEEFLLAECDADGAPWAPSTLERDSEGMGGALLTVSGAFAFPRPPPADEEGGGKDGQGGGRPSATSVPSPESLGSSPFALDMSGGVLGAAGLRVLPGELLVVCGAVGAGKSALIAACMGEMTLGVGGKGPDSGRSRCSPLCTFSFAPQVPWVRCGGTLRDNVLMGEEEDPERLARVLDAVGLAQEAAARGLDAVVSESTLSGGQRQRVGLARALYCRSTLVLLDDPTASLDAHVSTVVWERALGAQQGQMPAARGLGAFDARLCSFLAAEGRARVVATHDARFVAAADRVLVLEGGVAVYCGPPSGMSHAVERSAGLRWGDNGDANAATASAGASAGATATSPVASFPGASATTTRDSAATSKTDGPDDGAIAKSDDSPDEEARQAGRIKGAVLRSYAAMVGWPLAALVLTSLLIMQLSRNGSDLWLAVWSACTTDPNGATGPSAALVRWLASLGWGNTEFLRAFAVIAGVNFVSAAVRSWSFADAGLRAARLTHTRLIASIVAAPQGFHDATPAGRLTNRLSGDQFTIDDSLPFSLNILLAQAAGLGGTALVLAYSTSGAFIAVLPPLLVAFWRLQTRYRATSRELKRLESTQRSPLLSEFADLRSGEGVLIAASLQRPTGLSSAWGARAGGESSAVDNTASTTQEGNAADREAALTLRLLDSSQRASFVSGMASQWLALRLQALGLATLAAMAYSCVFLRIYADVPSSAAADDAGCSSGPPTDAAVGGGTSSGDAGAAGLAGLALSYALPIVYALQGLVGAVADTEREFIAVERAREYMDVLPEDERAAAECARVLNSGEGAAPQGRSVKRSGDVRGSINNGAYSALLEEEEGAEGESGGSDTDYAAPAPSSAAPAWRPRSGSVVFEGVSVSYAPGIRAPAVDCVSLRVPSGATLGICGVSGSGKSSLLATLWRVAPLAGGRVIVGGDDAACVPLSELRACLAAVPQEPFLVSGPLRLSLDTRGAHSDVALRAALRDVGLEGLSLDSPVLEGAANLSFGERQLVCLARALLQRAPVIGLDEPASAADAATDARMQAALSRASARSGTTVIIVAHRGAALVQCDFVVVMDGGRVVEGPAPPAALLADSQTRFARLVQAGH